MTRRKYRGLRKQIRKGKGSVFGFQPQLRFRQRRARSILRTGMWPKRRDARGSRRRPRSPARLREQRRSPPAGRDACQSNRRIDSCSRKRECCHLDAGFRKHRRKLIDDLASRDADEHRRRLVDSSPTEVNIILGERMQRIDLEPDRRLEILDPKRPADELLRTITSRRGSRTVAAICAAPTLRRNVASSAPHSAAGRVL